MADLKYKVEPVIDSDGTVKVKLGVERLLKREIPEVIQVGSV